MLFNSLEFLIFLPVVLCLYWLLAGNLRVQNIFVVCASYLFYGWWDYTFLFLIALTSFTSWAGALLIRRSQQSGNKGKWILACNVAIVLGVLCTYKYFDFFTSSFAEMLAVVGFRVDALTLGLVLPVGISFYTLQSLSYTFDVYSGRIAPTRDIIAYFAFVSFFPQLVAGPIERASNLLPQFLRHRVFSYGQAVDGMRQILWGLFKKMVVADNCAGAVNSIFDNYTSLDGGMLVWGAIFFAFQIYGDFSGYSDIAIGTARLFGIRLSKNFHYPYLSRDVAEFWRRWHISLNTWFVDYVYIPLGGSRGSLRLTIFNTLVIFLLSGFWHGANLTFIFWGLFNALLFIPLILRGGTHRHSGSVIAESSFLPRISEALQMFVTLGLVTVGWVFFRSETLSQAFGYLHHMVSDFSFVFPSNFKRSFVSVVFLFAVEWLQRRRDFGLQLPDAGIFRLRIVRWTVYYVMILIIIFASDQPQDFIYFQF